MKTIHNVPVSLIERDRESALPPGGGLAIVVAGSLLFWGAILWIVL